jgi:branched-chain amino acid transport system permease protein
MQNEKQKLPWKFIFIVIVLAGLISLPAFANRRILNIAILTLMYILLGESWNLLSGMAGLFNIVPAMFFGLGAYCMVLTCTRAELPWIVGLAIGLLINGSMASLVGFIGSKLSGLYFTMALIGLYQTVYAIMVQWQTFSGGYMGLSMPKRYLLSKPQQYYLILALAILSMLLFVFIRRHRVGTNFTALKENPDLAISLGSNIHAWRVLATILSAGISTVGGAFYAFYMMAVTPPVFAASISLKTIMVVMVGGVGNVFGPVVGSFMVILDEVIRGVMPSKFAAFSVIIYAFVLVLTALLKPGGLITFFVKKNPGFNIGNTLLDAVRINKKQGLS